MTPNETLRLEKFITRELDGIHQQITESKETSVRAHDELRDEVRSVGHRVDQLADKVNALEDARTHDLANQQGQSQVKQLVMKVAVNVITVLVSLAGAFFLFEDHLK